ncbi:nidogen-like [Brevipalpus obovatus]|uniref:nidogen-like n=1 Tax=Brevipalpus obovatus TaxID=246614 RepID=UPI003D9E03DB
MESEENSENITLKTLSVHQIRASRFLRFIMLLIVLTSFLLLLVDITHSQDTAQCPNNIICHQNARCKVLEDGSSRCECMAGYAGDGLICESLAFSCSGDSSCGPKAECVPSLNGQTRSCRCKHGFYGDGYTCTRNHEICRVNPLGQTTCECEPGFREVNEICEPYQLNVIDCSRTPNLCDPNARCITNAFQAGTCVCNEGYKGDGRTCVSLSQCKTDQDCPQFAKCVSQIPPNGTIAIQHCNCTEGTVMLNRECISIEKAPCNQVKNCHENAVCRQIDGQGYKCKCKPGYRGDGKICQSARQPCNVLNSCDRHAFCGYTPVKRGYRCYCKDGYSGDGYRCEPSFSCQHLPSQCHPDAECVFSNSNSYHCQCKPGFAGDGYDCLPKNHYEGSYLIYSHGMSLYRIPTQPDREGELMISFLNKFPVGIDVDCQKNSIFYTDMITKSLDRSSTNGSQSVELIGGLESPEGVAIDWIARNMYWTDSLERKIYVAKINGSYQRALIKTDLVNPRGLALYPQLGLMFWTDWNRAGPKIEAAYMDGTGRRTLIQENLKSPNMLAIDYTFQEVCWSDGGLKRVECTDFYGNRRRYVAQTGGHPFGIAIADGYIFWTDWETHKVYRVNRLGGVIEQLKTPKGASGKLHGIVKMPTACPSGGNRCLQKNGDCKYLCLATGNQDRTCLCPIGITDDPKCPQTGPRIEYPYPVVDIPNNILQ